MRIAVVGAGIFGTTIAIALGREGFSVELFEKDKDILRAASGINQFRLHRGYHYPRSIETAISSRRAEASFNREYGKAVLKNHEHYYCIAAKGSMVSGEMFKKFCNTCDLEFIEVDFPQAARGALDLTVKVKEALIDPFALKSIIEKRLRESTVKVFFNKNFSLSNNKFDLVVNCAYANLNSVIKKTVYEEKTYQFELCEKPIIQLPINFRGKSIVVMDGPFFCVDPYGRTDFHLIGNVVHAIHATNVGLSPKIPNEFKPFLNNGLIKNPPITNFKKFLESGAKIIPEIAEAKHAGSMYTVRTVLPGVDATDERPTIVSDMGKGLIQVFSGKIGNCVEAAEEVVALVKKSI